MPLVYEELHRLARQCMRRERAGHTLQTTALVNEAYLRLANSSRVQWQDRAHFFAIAAQLMRCVLVEEAALVLGVSTDIVKREWRTAKLWLLRELRATDLNG